MSRPRDEESERQSDVLDRASTIAERHLQAQLRQVRDAARRDADSRIAGTCLNCGQACEGLWCDADCRGDHEARETVLQRQGRRRP